MPPSLKFMKHLRVDFSGCSCGLWKTFVAIVLFLVLTHVPDSYQKYSSELRQETPSEISGFVSEEDSLSSRIIDQCNLHSKTRPLAFFRETCNITVGFIPISFRGIEDRDETFKMVAEIDLSWKHPCAHWDDDESAVNVAYFKMDTYKTWYPNLMLINGIVDILPLEGLVEKTRVYFHSDGKVSWPIVTTFVVYCELRFLKFPFDTQVCSVKFESWENTQMISWELEDQVVPMEESFISKAEIWELVNVTAMINVKKYRPPAELDYHQPTFVFILARKPATYVTNIFLPCITLQLLIIMSAIMPPHFPDRPAYCISVVLAYSVAQDVIRAETPKTSEISYIAVFLAAQFVTSAIIGVYALITNDLAHRARFRRCLSFNVSFVYFTPKFSEKMRAFLQPPTFKLIKIDTGEDNVTKIESGEEPTLVVQPCTKLQISLIRLIDLIFYPIAFVVIFIIDCVIFGLMTA